MPIYQIAIYEDDKGRRVIGRSEVLPGSPLLGPPQFYGEAIANTNQGPVPFPVPLDAGIDIHTAFETLDDTLARRARDAFNAHMRKMQDNQRDAALRQQLTLGGKMSPLKVGK